MIPPEFEAPKGSMNPTKKIKPKEKSIVKTGGRGSMNPKAHRFSEPKTEALCKAAETLI